MATKRAPSSKSKTKPRDTSGPRGSRAPRATEQTDDTSPSQSLAVREPSRALVEHAGQFQRWLDISKLEAQHERQTAAATQVSVKALLKQAKDEKEEIYRPIKQGLDALSAKYKKLTDPLEAVNTHLGRLIGSYDVAEREAAMRAAEREAKKAEKRGDEQFAEDVRLAAANTPLETTPGLRHYTVTRAKITNSQAFFEAVATGKTSIELLAAMVEAAEGVLSRWAKAGAPLPAGVEVTTEVHT